MYQLSGMAGPGDVINSRYALRELIDSGAMADVYLADDLRLGRQVAVKVLSQALARDPRAIERFHREAQAAAALSHPNVVAVYDWGTTDHTAFLVMQHVAGPDLRRVLQQRGQLPEAEAVRLAADVAAALDVAHRRGFVHRDVKPRNVLVDPNGSALLTDFGIAASTHAGGAAEPVYGTALYVAPEQARGLSVDGRADLYSLGALTYELLTGQPPFHGDSPGEVAAQHIHADVPAPRRLRPDLSVATERVVLRALEKEPARRFADAGEMRRALLEALQPSEAGQRTTPLAVAPGGRNGTAPLGRLATPRRNGHGFRPRRRWIWSLAAVPLIALAVAAVPGLATARQASVPDLAGKPVEDAKAAVATARLTLAVDEQPTQDTPAGLVVTQDPLPDARAAQGSTVHVVVSQGVSVPDLSGQQCAQARAAVSQTGWSVKPVRWRIANIADFGKVVAQDPAPGAVVQRKGEISVQVAGPVRPC